MPFTHSEEICVNIVFATLFDEHCRVRDEVWESLFLKQRINKSESKMCMGCYEVNGNNTLGLHSVIQMKLGKYIRSKEFAIQSESNYVH